MTTPPRVLVEAYNLSLTRGTGIATYTRTLAHALKSANFSVEALLDLDVPAAGTDPTLAEISLFDANPAPSWLIVKGLGIARHAVTDLFGVAVREVRVPQVVIDPLDRFHHHLFDRVGAITDLRDRAFRHFWLYNTPLSLRPAQRPDILHLTSAIPLRIAGTPTILTVHDLIPVRMPQACLDDKSQFFKIMKSALKHSTRILAVSEHTKSDISDIFNIPKSNIIVSYQTYDIPNAVLSAEDTTVAQHVENAFGLKYKDYFIFIGAIEPKKNLKRLIQAYMLSGSRKPLIIIGALGWQYEEDIEAISNAQRQLAVDANSLPRVRWLNYLPRNDLLLLLRGAHALCFPSLYEGFGLPVIEAMALGTAVMTSNVTAMPEIAGDAAHLVNPYDVQDMSAAITKIDQDKDYCADLVDKGRGRAEFFSPHAYHQRIGELYGV